ncbi:hypothetical protein UlMin_017012 [Ulmus minor]
MKKRNTVSCREYYCYKLQIRSTDKYILLHSGRLLQQYVIDMYVKIETQRLDYFRNRQDEIRAELYQGIIDNIECGETRASKIGRRIILPASFIGGPRDMRKRYMDAMSLVQRFGKPDIFLTITCNPNWNEIKQELQPHEEPQNRPDLVTRLPHAHFLIILKPNSKIIAPEDFDRIVSSELPNINKNIHLHSTVVKHMIHGPCGDMNPANVCMKKNGKCKNHYPKAYSPETYIGNNSYPKYKRRNDDNRWVIPYNPSLLAKFDCHMNVEICSTVKAVKYLYKYIYKGHDRIAFPINTDNDTNNIDEVENFQSARWISPPEAMWRIYGFTLNEMHPSVITLQLHLEDKQLITFRKSENVEKVINNNFSSRYMLTEYFHMNKTDKKARCLLYKQFPEHFVWSKRDKLWFPRKKHYAIGRVVTANPIEGERYYLRLLLNHIRGITSFEDLKTVNGVLTSSFREYALLHGLLKGDNNLTLCLQEASIYQMPYTLRRLFATILAYCEPDNPKNLWKNFENNMSEDYYKLNISKIDIKIKVLQQLNCMLESMGKNINDYQIVPYEINLSEDEKSMKEINEELTIIVSEQDLLAASTLNEQQKYAYDMILQKVFANESAAFFIDGPGGTGKTFLYRAILATIRSKNLIALATASSGVAAGILPGGRTAHSRFKLPLQIEDNITCSVSKQSGLAKWLQLTKLIIWDETPMIDRRAIEALDIMLQDINDCNLSFGGKVVVFGGDFRQVLPVVPRGRKEEIINTSLVMSYIWPLLIKIKLTENMRARLDPTFLEFLLCIGDGKHEKNNDDYIRLPSNMIIPYEDDNISLQKLIKVVFPNIEDYPKNLHFMVNRAILTPKNDYVDEINNLLMNLFPGDSIKYYSFDETLDNTEQSFQEDF